MVAELAGRVFELSITRPDVLLSNLISSDLSDGDEKNFGWSPASSLIAYIADQNLDGVFELFTDDPIGSSNAKVSGTLVSGGDNTKLSGDLVAGGNVLRFDWVPSP